ncbi:fluoride efflux transporter CrcB [Kordiimonas gwangyangensis]|uniref:fluoride efflux transporter CrcB n=1 Tax=Kordiimonas gwangyangensis TaxID=288022 RepID=UPI0003781BD4|nr:fluoride efflux transporter CrcB [Kordiimonas gwangyangensis]
MQMLLAVAMGGALGAVSRHYVAGQILRMTGPGFPYGTMVVNILGSLLMGLMITAFAVKFEASQELRGFLTVGLLGGFTTFSTYSLETAMLIERGDWTSAALYAFGSMAVGLVALFAGIWLGRVLI